MNKLVILMLLSSCATYAPESNDQKCARSGMKLVGLSHGSGTSDALVNGKLVSVDSRSEQVHCAIPSSEYDKCMVEANRKSLGPIDEYEEHIKLKQTATGIGWLLIVPGLGAKLYFDHQRDSAIKSSREIVSESALSCEKLR